MEIRKHKWKDFLINIFVTKEWGKMRKDVNIIISSERHAEMRKDMQEKITFEKYVIIF